MKGSTSRTSLFIIQTNVRVKIGVYNRTNNKHKGGSVMTRAEIARYLWNLEQYADKETKVDGTITYSLNGHELVDVRYNSKGKKED